MMNAGRLYIPKIDIVRHPNIVVKENKCLIHTSPIYINSIKNHKQASSISSLFTRRNRFNFQAKAVPADID